MKQALLAAREALNKSREAIATMRKNAEQYGLRYAECYSPHTPKIGGAKLQFDLLGILQDQMEAVPEFLIESSQALALIESALSDDVWQPIETAPKDGTVFLGLTENGVHQIIKRNKHLSIWVDVGGRESYRTMDYWMPLPPPPAAAQKGAEQ